MGDLREDRVLVHPRLWPSLAAAATGLGLVLVAVAVVSTRRLWWGGYVSEAGSTSSVHPSLYRVGILALSVGQVLLAAAIRARVRLIWVTGLLLLAGLAGAVSASVPCSAGCPLPPHETPAAADLVHGGFSILAIGFIALAILALAFVFGPEAPARRLADALPALADSPVAPAAVVPPSRVAAFVVVPLVAASGLAILVFGRGAVTGVLERAVLVGVAGWTLAMCARLASYPS